MSSTDQKQPKLPYFHRTLSPEENALIGDITPKPISNTTTTGSSSETMCGKISDGSAWNSAKTWEERDCSSWARGALKAVLTEKLTELQSGTFRLQFKTITEVKGDAQITHIRGTARFMYEMSFTSSFSLHDTTSNKKYEGKLSIADIINDQLDDMEITVDSWTVGQTPANADLKAIKTFLTGKTIKKYLKDAIEIFNQKYKDI